MPNVLIRDLPEDIHAVLRRRATREGKSLQQYLFGVLRQLAARPTIDELMDRVERRSGGRVTFQQAAEDLAADRHRR